LCNADANHAKHSNIGKWLKGHLHRRGGSQATDKAGVSHERDVSTNAKLLTYSVDTLSSDTRTSGVSLVKRRTDA